MSLNLTEYKINQLNTNTMKTNQKFRETYASPLSKEISMTSEGVLCSSFEVLNQFNYIWEEEE